jgi:hypothetical protein
MRVIPRERHPPCSWVSGFGRWVALALLLAACRRETPARPNDTARSTVTPPSVSPPDSVSPSAWDVNVGAVLAIPAGSAGSAFVIVPQFTGESSLDSASFDLSAIEGTKLDLLAEGRRVAVATLASPATPRDSGCTSWPTAHVEVQGAGALPVWSAGFVAGSVEPIPFDSLQSLSRADSTRLSVELAKLASAVPNDTATAFRGRPFIVRTVRRFQAYGRSVVVAEIVRNVNQEAMPLQEHLLLIAERDSSVAPTYVRSYYERTIGLEDAVETTDVLAVVRPVGDDRVYMLLSRDFGDGVSYALLERVPAGEWHLRWSSAYAGC